MCWERNKAKRINAKIKLKLPEIDICEIRYDSQFYTVNKLRKT